MIENWECIRLNLIDEFVVCYSFIEIIIIINEVWII